MGDETNMAKDLGLSVIVLALFIFFTTQYSGDGPEDLEPPEKIVYDIVEEYDDKKELHCMALNIYYEARSDNLAGKYAVADVVLNRVESERYPPTICTVVKQGKYYEGKPVKNKCQFSWYCDGKTDTPEDTESWQEALEIAEDILVNDTFRGITDGATHYHAHYVSPYWSQSGTMIRLGTIGSHKFYKRAR